MMKIHCRGRIAKDREPVEGSHPHRTWKATSRAALLPVCAALMGFLSLMSGCQFDQTITPVTPTRLPPLEELNG